MKLPDITHLQYLVLSELFNKERAGRDIRASLLASGVKQTAPAFYQLMARMEDAGWIEGWYEQKVIDGVGVKARWYRIVGKGRRVAEAVEAFYAARGGLAFG